MKPLTILLGLMILSSSCTSDLLPETDPPETRNRIQEILTQVQPTPGILPHIDPWSVSGEIIIAGSSTVFPLSERLAERFQDEGFPGNVTIDSIGSGAGFERFCVSSETDITNASRPIKDSEREACRAIGRDPLEFRIGTDALAVVVSRDNNFVHDITLEQLAAVFSTAQTWSQVDPSWPDEPIQRFSPGTDSGTYDYFVEAVFDKDEEPLLRAENLQFSEDDNVLVKGIAGSPYAIGYFGYAYYLENADDLNLLSIDGVTASPEAIDQDIYPLARPLYIYSDAGIMRSKPQVAAFINFVLIYTNEEVISVGYFPASTAVLDTSIKIWMEAIQ